MVGAPVGGVRLPDVVPPPRQPGGEVTGGLFGGGAREVDPLLGRQSHTPPPERPAQGQVMDRAVGGASDGPQVAGRAQQPPHTADAAELRPGADKAVGRASDEQQIVGRAQQPPHTPPERSVAAPARGEEALSGGAEKGVSPRSGDGVVWSGESSVARPHDIPPVTRPGSTEAPRLPQKASNALERSAPADLKDITVPAPRRAPASREPATTNGAHGESTKVPDIRDVRSDHEIAASARGPARTEQDGGVRPEPHQTQPVRQADEAASGADPQSTSPPAGARQGADRGDAAPTDQPQRTGEPSAPDAPPLNKGKGRAEPPGGAEPQVVAGPPYEVRDSAGELRHVLSPDGLIRHRGLNGEWSEPVANGKVLANELEDPVRLPLAGGGTVELRSGHRIFDARTREPQVYRSQDDHPGPSSAGGNTFVRRSDGAWDVLQVPSAEYEAWRLGRNGKLGISQKWYNIAGKRLDELPEGERIPVISQMLRRGGLDADAAIYNIFEVDLKKPLRGHQMDAVDAFKNREGAQVRAGAGKTFAYQVHAIGRALKSGGVQFLTTTNDLVKEAMDLFRTTLEPYGFKIVRMNEKNDVPKPEPGEPTIYVGTFDDNAFSWHEGPAPVRDVILDEGDVLYLSDTVWQIRKGANEEMGFWEKRAVVNAVSFVKEKFASGFLTAADFGRVPGRPSRPPELTESGRARVGQVWWKWPFRLTDRDVSLINRAAAVQLGDLVEKTHYRVRNGNVYIIRGFDHKLLADLEKITTNDAKVTRWTDYTHAVLEAWHGLTIHTDNGPAKSLTARDIYNPTNYDHIATGSGTLKQFEDALPLVGLPAKVRVIEPYFEDRLVIHDDDPKIFNTHEEMLEALATKLAEVKKGGPDGGPRLPQLVVALDNKEPGELSAILRDKKVDHVMVDADWELDVALDTEGPGVDAAFQKLKDQAGLEEALLVTNLYKGSRGLDVLIERYLSEAGGLQVYRTGWSDISAAVDEQIDRRAGRNGQRGDAWIFASVDRMFKNSHNPDLPIAVIKWQKAVEDDRFFSTPGTRADIAQAVRGIRDLVPTVQAEAEQQLKLQRLIANLINSALAGTALGAAGREGRAGCRVRVPGSGQAGHAAGREGRAGCRVRVPGSGQAGHAAGREGRAGCRVRVPGSGEAGHAAGDAAGREGRAGVRDRVPGSGQAGHAAGHAAVRGGRAGCRARVPGSGQAAHAAGHAAVRGGRAGCRARVPGSGQAAHAARADHGRGGCVPG